MVVRVRVPPRPAEVLVRFVREASLTIRVPLISRGVAQPGRAHALGACQKHPCLPPRPHLLRKGGDNCASPQAALVRIQPPRLEHATGRSLQAYRPVVGHPPEKQTVVGSSPTMHLPSFSHSRARNFVFGCLKQQQQSSVLDAWKRVFLVPWTGKVRTLLVFLDSHLWGQRPMAGHFTVNEANILLATSSFSPQGEGDNYCEPTSNPGSNPGVPALGVQQSEAYTHSSPWESVNFAR